MSRGAARSSEVGAGRRRPASLPGVRARRSPLDATPSIDPAATVLPLVATLALTFVIGLEREERVARDRTLVGGVRTIPIVGLLGHAMALLGRASALPTSSLACQRIGHDMLSFGDDGFQVRLTSEALCVYLVDVFGPGGPSREP